MLTARTSASRSRSQPRAGDVESRRCRGAILGALVIQRLGSRDHDAGDVGRRDRLRARHGRTRLDPSDTVVLMVMLLLTGGLLNAVQTTMYALARTCIPTDIRSTGVGLRSRSAASATCLPVYVGAYALDRGGSPGYFTSMAILMGIVFLSLAAVRRHVPRTTGAPWRRSGGAH